jgi:hypothetical protein
MKWPKAAPTVALNWGFTMVFMGTKHSVAMRLTSGKFEKIKQATILNISETEHGPRLSSSKRNNVDISEEQFEPASVWLRFVRTGDVKVLFFSEMRDWHNVRDMCCANHV